MNYDEAIVAFHDMHPEYDTANGGTHLLHDKVLDALKRAQKVEKLLELYRNLEAWVEEYNTSDSTLRKQGLLAEIRVARHLIAELESEMK